MMCVCDGVCDGVCVCVCVCVCARDGEKRPIKSLLRNARREFGVRVIQINLTK